MKLFRRRYNGFTKETPQNMQLDAGAFFKNFKVGTDTYQSAKASDKLLCATSGGGECVIKPSYLKVAVDGVPERTMGLITVDDIEIYIKTTAIDITTDVLIAAIGAAKLADSDSIPEGYDCIKGKNSIEDDDFIENITWIGNLVGSEKPIIIQLYNAFDEDGLSFKVADKDNGKVDLTFYAYNDPEKVAGAGENELEPPFAIFRPITKNNTPAVASEQSSLAVDGVDFSAEDLEQKTSAELFDILITLEPATDLTAASEKADLIDAIISAQSNN